MRKGNHHNELTESLQGHELLETYICELFGGMLTEKTANADDDFDYVVGKQLAKRGLRLADIDEPSKKTVITFDGDQYEVYVVQQEKSNSQR